MAFREAYRRQVALLIRTIPYIAQEDSFALKGGTREPSSEEMSTPVTEKFLTQYICY
jgi:hypothetical protein